jgi:hypothetical protein
MTGEQRLDELDPVVEKQRDAVPCLHPAGGENLGEAGGALMKLRMSADLLAEHHGGLIGTRSGGSAGQFRQHEPAGLLESS